MQTVTLFIFLLGIRVNCGITDNEMARRREFLIDKWKEWYRAVDVDHDGIVTWKDEEKFSGAFIDRNHIRGDRTYEVKGVAAHWWNKCFFRNGPGRAITKQEFIENFNVSWTKDKAAFRDEMKECFDEIVDVVDTNRDGFIDLKEHTNGYKASGNRALFREFDLFLSDGKVPVEDYVDVWLIFLTSDDPYEGRL